jgi:hypothetical protein
MQAIIDFFRYNTLLVVILLAFIIGGILVINRNKAPQEVEVVSEKEIIEKNDYPIWEKIDKSQISTLDSLPEPTPEASPAANLIEEKTQEATESAEATSSSQVTSTAVKTTEVKTEGYYYYIPAHYEWDVVMTQEQTSEIKN